MPTHEELLSAIAEHVGEDRQKAREFAAALKGNEGTKTVAEVLIAKGIGKRTGEAQQRAGELQQQITTLQEKLDEAQQEVSELRGKEPNWQRRLDDQDRKHREKLEAKDKEIEAEKQARRNDSLAIHKERFRAELGLGKPGGVEEEWGSEVLPAKFADRFTLDDDGKLKVLEPGETTAYDPSDGDPVKQLARDVLAGVPSKYRLMGEARPGGGVSQGSNGAQKPRTDQEIQEGLRKAVGYATP